MPDGLYDFQQAAVDHIIRYNDTYGSITMVGTGLGKTHVAAKCVSVFGKTAAVAVLSGLVRQTCRVMQRLLGGWTVTAVESHTALASPRLRITWSMS